MTRRWPFIVVAVLIGTLIAPLAGSAQQAASTRRIGFLSVSPAPQGPAPYPYLEGFRQGLRERGWIEGQNLTVEYRCAAGKEDSLPDLARSPSTQCRCDRDVREQASARDQGHREDDADRGAVV